MTTISTSHLARVAKESLLTAGAVVRKGFSQKRRVTFKSATSPVTDIDLLAEKTIASLVRRHFSDHDFLAEESDYLKHGDPLKKKGRVFRSKVRDRYRWVVDPLDGTVNFVHGIPQISVSVAVERNGTVLAGGVYDPLRDELFFAQKGRGATLNGRRIRVSKENKLGKALLVTGFAYDRQQRASFYAKFVRAFLRRSMDLRRFGSAAIDMAWIACGRAEGYWEYHLNPWDVAAGLLLVEEAGGKVTDFRGEPFDIERPYQTLATNTLIHGQMLKVFRGL